jgi:hypothetical protein
MEGEGDTYEEVDGWESAFFLMAKFLHNIHMFGFHCVARQIEGWLTKDFYFICDL